MEKYQKESLISAGRFSSLWLVKSIQTSTYYFVKETKMNLLSEYEENRILNEIKVLSECEHNHIIHYKDTIIQHAEAKLSLIMEYADGGSLLQAIAKQHGVPFSENKTLSWFIQICLALQYLHDQNILHGDLQPNNILLTRNETIKVGGFASSKMLKDSEDVATDTIGVVCYDYKSPESIRQRPYNLKHDMWALGCILFQISTLQLCFKGRTYLERVNAILDGKRAKFPHWCSLLERGIVRDLLRYDPNQRPTPVEILTNPLLQPYLTKYLLQTSRESKSSEVKIRRVSSSRLLNNRDFFDERASSESTPFAAQQFDSYETPQVVYSTKLTAPLPIEYAHAAIKNGRSSLKYSSSLREVNLKAPIKTTKHRNLLQSESAMNNAFLVSTESGKKEGTTNSVPAPKDQSEDMHANKDTHGVYHRTKGMSCTSDGKINVATSLSEKGNEQFVHDREMIAGTTVKRVHNTSLGFDTAKFETKVSSRVGEYSDHFNCEQSQCSQCVIDMLWKNRIRGCIEVTTNRGEYLKLKDRLSLVFENDLFQKVYQSLVCDWYGSEIEEPRFAINNVIKTLNHNQVRHLPLMLQLVQLELLLKQSRERRASTAENISA